MVDFVRKRLQVFVSSTFSDLIPERQASVEAILTAGHIPAGMELFTSGDESQMDVIKQWIDESDVYLLILGGRYGSIEPKSGKSYSQLEYEYALSKDKPLFSCVIKESALENRVKTDGTKAIETQEPQKLKAFREMVLSKMVRFWEDSKDIKISIGETLSHFARRDELKGWVRESTQANMPALADEIARLSRENAELRGQLTSNKSELLISGISFEDMKNLLQRKDLLDFFVLAKTNLLSRNEFADRDLGKMQELMSHGLVTRRAWAEFELTLEGRMLLTRLEAEQLKESS